MTARAYPDLSWAASPDRQAVELRPMRECPRYNVCNANVCPLDPDWSARGHVAGDEICRWLLEVGKPGAHQRFIDAGWEDLYRVAVDSLPAISRRHADVGIKVERAKSTGSAFDRGANLAKYRAGQDAGNATADEATDER